MTEDELLALLSTSPAGIRGAQNATLAAARTPLANIEASGPPSYRVPLMRAGAGQQYVYPGFGIDPERLASTNVPTEGTAGAGGGTDAGGVSGTDINALLAGLGGSGGSSAGGSSSGSGLASLGGGAGLSLAAISALLKAAPWLAKQLGLTDQQAAAISGPGGIPFSDMTTQPYTPLPGDTSTNIGMASGEGIQAGVSAIPWDQMVTLPANGTGIFTPDANPVSIPNADTLNPDLPSWLDNSTIGPPQDIGQISQDVPASVNASDFMTLPTGTLPSDAAGIFTEPSSASGGTLPDNATGIFTPDDLSASINFGDFGTVSDLGGAVGGAGFGAPELGGYGFDPFAPDAWEGFSDLANPLGFGGEMLGLGDTTVSLLDGAISFDPVSALASVAGGYAGTRLAAGTARGDEQQAWASRIGGTLGTILLPGIGTFLGSYLGGYLGSGEPDDPFAAFDGQVFSGNDQGGGFGLGGVYTSNGGQASNAEQLRGWLLDQINARAASEGLAANPEMVNQPGFSAGFEYRPGYSDPLFYRWREPGSGAKPDEASWRGTNDATGRQQLLDTAWRDLVDKNYFIRQGDQAWDSWGKVNAQLQQNAAQPAPAMKNSEGYDYTVPTPPAQEQTYRPQWDNGQDVTRVNNERGYVTTEWVGGGEAGEQQNTTWHAGPPPESPAPEPAPEPAPQDMPGYYDQGGAARTGGLIRPTPGGTQPVPITAHSGEFVIRPEAVAKFGPEMLTAINRGTFPHMPEPGETDMVEMGEHAGGQSEEQEEAGEMEEYDDDEGFDAFTRPYADIDAEGPSPFERVTGEATGRDPMAAMRDLPPEVQQGMLLAIGADPLMASAWLQVLGPEYQQVIAKALKAAGMMKQQQAMAMQGSMPGMMPGAPPAAPPPGMMG